VAARGRLLTQLGRGGLHLAWAWGIRADELLRLGLGAVAEFLSAVVRDTVDFAICLCELPYDGKVIGEAPFKLAAIAPRYCALAVLETVLPRPFVLVAVVEAVHTETLALIVFVLALVCVSVFFPEHTFAVRPVGHVCACGVRVGPALS
jgi:hypothetical protein